MKVEAGVGLRGPVLEPVGAGEQTGAAVRTGQLGCGKPAAKEDVERGQEGCRDDW